MRTHRLKITCASSEYADFFEEEILHIEFCDLTHWYCGLDKAGADTPDSCVIYRGVYDTKVIYVEFDISDFGTTQESKIVEQYDWYKTSFDANKPDWRIVDVTCEKLPAYEKILELQSKLDATVVPS